MNVAFFCGVISTILKKDQLPFAQKYYYTRVTCKSDSKHTIYTGNNMGQKCEGNCGLWVLNEILKKTYPENLKKIVGAVWELPAK